MQTDEEKLEINFKAYDANDDSNIENMKTMIENFEQSDKSTENQIKIDEITQARLNEKSCLSSHYSSAIQVSDPSSEELPTKNMLANSGNSILEQARNPQMLNSSIISETKNKHGTSFANINVMSGESGDKIWSLADSVAQEDFNGSQSYVDRISQNMTSFSDQSLLHKAQNQQNQSIMKRPLAGSGTNINNSQVIHGNRDQMGFSPNSSPYNNLNSKNYSNVNWSGVQPSLTWSNNFNSTLPSVPSSLNSFSTTSSTNSIQHVWSNGLYNNFNNQPKRPPVACQNATNETGMKLKLDSTNQKYRRNVTVSAHKNFSNNPLTNSGNVYDLGSTGSDNTSSSSDSANLRENGLLQLQERNLDSNNSPLDTIRYSLEPQLMEIMRNSTEQRTQDNKAINFNFPYQTLSQDDKKHLKGRNFGRRRGKSPFFTGNDSENLLVDFNLSNNEHNERFSRKVFVGGLPPDIDEEEITASFRRFGPLVVDWPHKAESKSYFPPKGYAFLLFQDETSVQMLIDACIQEEDKLYLCVSSPTIKDKPVQIRPWRLSDADYVLDASMPLDPRKTVFVGGVPRPLKAVELAMIMDRLYGGVCYAGIDTDPELKYPKGAGRVAFSNQQSYIAAISARFVQLQHADIEKRVEVKPYVLDDQICDECQGARCGGKFAPYFCANITCLQYYCENCWATIHSRPGREFHKPLVKEGADRPRAVPFRWC